MANWSNAKKIEAGEIWTCFEGKKTRPVVILKEELVSLELDFNIARITSQRPRNEFDVKIQHWKEAGLDMESYVRCSKINTVHKLELKRKIGKLHEDDLNQIKKMVSKYFSF